MCIRDRRYAYRPEYTSGYAEKGLDPSVWVAEDSILALPDIRNIYTKDIAPNLETDMPVIVTGDFNSCSHLDWTERAKPLHHGYGPVAFPASRYMPVSYTPLCGYDCFAYFHYLVYR